MCDVSEPDEITLVIQMFIEEMGSGIYAAIMEDEHNVSNRDFNGKNIILITGPRPTHVWARVIDGYVWLADKTWALDRRNSAVCLSKIDLAQPGSLQMLRTEIERILDDW